MSFEVLLAELTAAVMRKVIREELPKILAGTSRPPEDRRVTATEAAAAAGVSIHTLRRWVRDGRVQRFGDGRSHRYSLAEVLDAEPWPSPLIQGAV